MLPSTAWPLWANIAIFVGAAAAIGWAGTRLAAVADKLADRTGIGEAMVGGLLLAISTSLSGITTSVTAALDGRAELAVSNAIGGIAAQTVFLAVADFFHRRINLEHAAASAANLLQTALLIVLLALLVGVMTGPSVSVWDVHPGTPLLVIAYLAGYVMVYRQRESPMWKPQQTAETILDEPRDDSKQESLARLWTLFIIAGAVVFVSGVIIAKSGGAIADQVGMSETLMGALFTSVATSLPELITAIAAVRRGALTLAVGDIVGGNAFDLLFICAADIAYRGGSIYHAAGRSDLFLLGATILMTATILLGLLRRQKRGIANIGFESALVLVSYITAILIIAFVL